MVGSLAARVVEVGGRTLVSLLQLAAGRVGVGRAVAGRETSSPKSCECTFARSLFAVEFEHSRSSSLCCKASGLHFTTVASIRLCLRRAARIGAGEGQEDSELSGE